MNNLMIIHMDEQTLARGHMLAADFDRLANMAKVDCEIAMIFYSGPQADFHPDRLRTWHGVVTHATYRGLKCSWISHPGDDFAQAATEPTMPG